jgi:hypothetical protein
MLKNKYLFLDPNFSLIGHWTAEKYQFLSVPSSQQQQKQQPDINEFREAGKTHGLSVSGQKYIIASYFVVRR